MVLEGNWGKIITPHKIISNLSKNLETARNVSDIYSLEYPKMLNLISFSAKSHVPMAVKISLHPKVFHVKKITNVFSGDCVDGVLNGRRCFDFDFTFGFSVGGQWRLRSVGGWLVAVVFRIVGHLKVRIHLEVFFEVLTLQSFKQFLSEKSIISRIDSYFKSH